MPPISSGPESECRLIDEVEACGRVAYRVGGEARHARRDEQAWKGHGAWNMAVDESLLDSAITHGIATLRFYTWPSPTLSLGYFQAAGHRSDHPPSAGCSLIRRLTGGGAIVHDTELTYSLAVPPTHHLAKRHVDLYRLVHDALAAALLEHDVTAFVWGKRGHVEPPLSDGPQGTPASPRPATPRAIEKRTREPFLCFARRAEGDLVVGNVKIAGSAQRLIRGAVLQHGSVLLAVSAHAPELHGVYEATGISISPAELAESCRRHICRAIGFSPRCSLLRPSERRCARALVSGKYGSDSWNLRR